MRQAPVPVDEVRRFSAIQLAQIVPGVSKMTWTRQWIPRLIRSGVLRKEGKGWIGRPVDIQTALLNGFEPRRSPRRRGVR